MYQRLYDAITKYDADICSCGYYEESEDASWKYSHGCKNDLLVLDGPEQIYSELFRHESIIGNGNWNKLFRQTILDDVRFKKYVVGEDVEFQCMAIHEAKRMVCISDVMYHYIHNPGNATSSKFRPQSMDIIAVVDSLLDFIKANHPRVLEQMYAYHLMWYMATVQVMHWSKDTRPYKKEKDQLRGVIINNFEKYKNNRYVYKLDKVFMYAFIYGLFRPVYSMFRIYRKMK